MPNIKKASVIAGNATKTKNSKRKHKRIITIKKYRARSSICPTCKYRYHKHHVCQRNLSTSAIQICPTIRIVKQQMPNFSHICQQIETQYFNDYGAVKLTFEEGIFQQNSEPINEIVSHKQLQGATTSTLQEVQPGVFIRKIKHFRKSLALNTKNFTQAAFWKKATKKQEKFYHGGIISNGKLLSSFENQVPSITENYRQLFPKSDITYPYISPVGTRMSFFGFHKDPYGFPALNFIVKGGSKIWYVIPNKNLNQFNQILAKFKSDSRYCEDHGLPHSIMLGTSILEKIGQKVIQHQHQMVLVLSNVYHSGINLGANVSYAQAAVTSNWKRNAKHTNCNCQDRISKADLKRIKKLK